MKVFVSLTFILAILFAFQNCGETARNTTFFSEQYVESSGGCSTLECLNNEEFLWMKIREYEPYKVPADTLGTHFTVGGQCGTSGFWDHSFLWELREAFGAQRIIAANSSDNRCVLGQFQVPIIFGSVPPTLDQRYQLTMEIVGYNDRGERINNPMPASKATLDVIFYIPPAPTAPVIETRSNSQNGPGPTR